MLIHRGNIIAGGGTIVMPMTRAEYEANKAVLDSADVWVDLTDEPDSVADGECIQYDSDLNFEDIGNIATKAIAKVEPSDTALYLHNVGTYFINKDGNMCKTDLQISVGGTITLGTNCHVCSDGVANDINSNLAKHDLGTPINVTPYENTPYTVPSDGYVWCDANGANANAKIKIGSGVNTFEAIACGNTGRGGRATVFVRKDTVVTVSVDGGTLYQAWFYPLV